MMMEQVFAYALQLAGELTEQRSKMLEALCRASTSALSARLQTGLIPEDCEEDFVMAAALTALAALAGISTDTTAEQITAGDFSIRKEAVCYDGAAANLHAQAERIMAPYLMDRFSLYYRVVVFSAPLQGHVLHCRGCCGSVSFSYRKTVPERLQPQPFTVLLIS